MEHVDLERFSSTARDHAANPRNHGSLEDFDGHARITGPCGDTMEFWLRAADGKILQVSFITDGCGSSLACGSMATTLAEGRPLESVIMLNQKDILDGLGKFPRESAHCALLAVNTLKAACEDSLSIPSPTGWGLMSRSRHGQREQQENQRMRIAIPLANGKLAMHFGHCERFALVEVDTTEKKIIGREDIEAPPHQPGLLPPWLAERGATIIIAGGMGQRALGLFAAQGIQVVLGAGAATPERLVSDYLAGTLETGENACDH